MLYSTQLDPLFGSSWVESTTTTTTKAGGADSPLFCACVLSACTKGGRESPYGFIGFSWISWIFLDFLDFLDFFDFLGFIRIYMGLPRPPPGPPGPPPRPPRHLQEHLQVLEDHLQSGRRGRPLPRDINLPSKCWQDDGKLEFQDLALEFFHVHLHSVGVQRQRLEHRS